MKFTILFIEILSKMFHKHFLTFSYGVNFQIFLYMKIFIMLGCRKAHPIIIMKHTPDKLIESYLLTNKISLFSM